jgi:molybdate transport system ATP-binding protein
MGLSFSARHRFPSGFVLDTSFTLERGVTALCGPSGNGKSTVLAILAGTLCPQEGEVILDEKVFVDTKRGICLAPEDRGVGFVFQDHLLFPHMTVGANLRYGLRRKPGRTVDFGRVVEILEIGDLIERAPRTLSGGQRQRVALGRALLRGPSLLLLDEPLTGLDAALKERIVTYLARAFDEWKVPTLFVSHDAADVERLAERIIYLKRGEISSSPPSGPRLVQVAADVA